MPVPVSWIEVPVQTVYDDVVFSFLIKAEQKSTSVFISMKQKLFQGGGEESVAHSLGC